MQTCWGLLLFVRVPKNSRSVTSKKALMRVVLFDAKFFWDLDASADAYSRGLLIS